MHVNESLSILFHVGAAETALELRLVLLSNV